VEPSINYIVACYLGQRRTPVPHDPANFISAQLDWLDKNRPGIERVSIVINARNGDDVRTASGIVKEFMPFYTDIKVYGRPNAGYSYVAWSETISNSIEAKDDFSHFVLVEDDYIPGRNDFLEILESRLVDSVGYVCQKVYEAVPGGFPRHTALPHGMLRADAARAVYDTFGTVFGLDPTQHYVAADTNQRHWMDLLQELGYTFTDTSDVSDTIFCDLDGSMIDIDSGIGDPTFRPIELSDIIGLTRGKR